MYFSDIDQILSIIKNKPITAQNILMKISDREIALFLLSLDKKDRYHIYSILPEEKIKRIKEELCFQKKLTIKYEIFKKINNKFLEYFKTGQDKILKRTYIKPKFKK